MKIKLDENLPDELADLLAASHHDVHTVRGESLVGRDDQTVFAVAVREQRILRASKGTSSVGGRASVFSGGRLTALGCRHAAISTGRDATVIRSLL